MRNPLSLLGCQVYLQDTAGQSDPCQTHTEAYYSYHLLRPPWWFDFLKWLTMRFAQLEVVQLDDFLLVLFRVKHHIKQGILHPCAAHGLDIRRVGRNLVKANHQVTGRHIDPFLPVHWLLWASWIFVRNLCMNIRIVSFYQLSLMLQQRFSLLYICIPLIVSVCFLP